MTQPFFAGKLFAKTQSLPTHTLPSCQSNSVLPYLAKTSCPKIARFGLLGSLVGLILWTPFHPQSRLISHRIVYLVVYEPPIPCTSVKSFDLLTIRGKMASLITEILVPLSNKTLTLCSSPLTVIQPCSQKFLLS